MAAISEGSGGGWQWWREVDGGEEGRRQNDMDMWFLSMIREMIMMEVDSDGDGRRWWW